MRPPLALAVMLFAPSLARAQARWKPIGTTNSGNTVFVDPRTVKRAGGLVGADVRVVFTTPVQTAKGLMASTRTSATFDCARKKLAGKESVDYSDARSTKVIDRRVNKIPGYGTVFGGSLGDVALKYLCTPP